MTTRHQSLALEEVVVLLEDSRHICLSIYHSLDKVSLNLVVCLWELTLDESREVGVADRWFALRDLREDLLELSYVEIWDELEIVGQNLAEL